MVTVRQFASRAILLDKGKLVKEGPVGDVIAYYTDVATGVLAEADVSGAPRFDPNLGQRARITKVRLNHDQGVVGSDSDISYSVTVDSHEDLPAVRLSHSLHSADGVPVGASFGEATSELRAGHQVELDVLMPCPGLAPGHYSFAIGIGFGGNAGFVDLDVVLDTVHFEVLPPVSLDGRLMNWNDAWGQVRFAPLQVVQGESACLP
jgi:hypothetical protein